MNKVFSDDENFQVFAKLTKLRRLELHDMILIQSAKFLKDLHEMFPLLETLVISPWTFGEENLSWNIKDFLDILNSLGKVKNLKVRFSNY